MAQLKDLIVNGASQLIGDAYVNTIQITKINAPTTAGGSTYGGGTAGNVLTSNGTSIYWSPITWSSVSGAPDYILTSAKGTANGVASLDANGKVPSSQLPSYVDDVLEYNNLSSFPASGTSGIIYIAKDTNKTYRWSGSDYVEISASLALGETSSTAYAGDKGKTAYTHATDSNRLTTGKTLNLYKVATTPEGHIQEVQAVVKADITALGIPGENTNTASAVDNILDGSNSGTAITYAPYGSQQSKLSFDTSSSNPTRTDRLNLNGVLYATKLYSNGIEVLTAHQSLSGYKTKQAAVSDPTASGNATTFISTITQDVNGVITATKKNLPTTMTPSSHTHGPSDLTGLKTLTIGSNSCNVFASQNIDIPIYDGTYS